MSTNDSSSNFALVKLYPPPKHKEEWYHEAREHGISASKYLQELIQEAVFFDSKAS